MVCGGAGWPEFHNGVAAALRLSLGQTAISRTWIVYNKPESANYAHAGVLMGLGLQGHLKVFVPVLKRKICTRWCAHGPRPAAPPQGICLAEGLAEEELFVLPRALHH